MADSDGLNDDPRLLELKLRALAEFAAGAGHEINNPVATIAGYAQQLLAGETDPDRRHALATIGAQAYRIRDMIGDAMLFARPPRPQPEPINLALAIRDVVGKLADEASNSGIQIQVEVPDDVALAADPVQFRVAMSSLLRNGVEALSQGGRVVVTTRPVVESGRRWTRITVADDGPGLSDVEREHLFDPFFSGRQAGRGLGFGLPKVWRIVTMHGGRIAVETPAGGGLKFVIDWPLQKE